MKAVIRLLTSLIADAILSMKFLPNAFAISDKGTVRLLIIVDVACPSPSASKLRK